MKFVNGRDSIRIDTFYTRNLADDKIIVRPNDARGSIWHSLKFPK